LSENEKQIFVKKQFLFSKEQQHTFNPLKINILKISYFHGFKKSPRNI